MTTTWNHIPQLKSFFILTSKEQLIWFVNQLLMSITTDFLTVGMSNQ